MTLNICLADLPVKLPHLEVYEQASGDKSKQQPGLRPGLPESPGLAFACLCFAVALHLEGLFAF